MTETDPGNFQNYFLHLTEKKKKKIFLIVFKLNFQDLMLSSFKIKSISIHAAVTVEKKNLQPTNIFFFFKYSLLHTAMTSNLCPFPNLILFKNISLLIFFPIFLLPWKWATQVLAYVMGLTIFLSTGISFKCAQTFLYFVYIYHISIPYNILYILMFPWLGKCQNIY